MEVDSGSISSLLHNPARLPYNPRVRSVDESYRSSWLLCWKAVLYGVFGTLKPLPIYASNNKNISF
jgi:hypothetical protein